MKKKWSKREKEIFRKSYEEMKPCPHCGCTCTTGLKLTGFKYRWFTPTVYYIKCDKCGFGTESSVSIRRAIRFWNRMAERIKEES